MLQTKHGTLYVFARVLPETLYFILHKVLTCFLDRVITCYVIIGINVLPVISANGDGIIKPSFHCCSIRLWYSVGFVVSGLLVSNRKILRFSRFVYIHSPHMANASMGWEISPPPTRSVRLCHSVGTSFRTPLIHASPTGWEG